MLLVLVHLQHLHLVQCLIDSEVMQVLQVLLHSRVHRLLRFGVQPLSLLVRDYFTSCQAREVAQVHKIIHNGRVEVAEAVAYISKCAEHLSSHQLPQWWISGGIMERTHSHMEEREEAEEVEQDFLEQLEPSRRRQLPNSREGLGRHLELY